MSTLRESARDTERIEAAEDEREPLGGLAGAIEDEQAGDQWERSRQRWGWTP